MPAPVFISIYDFHWGTPKSIRESRRMILSMNLPLHWAGTRFTRVPNFSPE